jgi:hypothetical protein
MTGKELLDWLKEIPEEDLRRCRVVLDTSHDTEPLITTHVYLSKPTSEPMIHLIYK